MLHFFDLHAPLFKAWQVERYEQEGETYYLKIKAVLKDDSLLELRDYLFADGNRKYSYQWMETDGSLRYRWDNAPHWVEIDTSPHHIHIPGKSVPEPSLVSNIEDLLYWIENWFNAPRG